MTRSIAILDQRSVISVGGPEAATFLQGLVTSDVETLAAGAARYAALLTPQGKILFDFLVLGTADGFRLDVAALLAADLAKRLRFYRLRAKVEIADVGETTAVAALWGGPPPEGLPGLVHADPRLAALGHRILVDRADLGALETVPGLERKEAADWHAHRIRLGVPEGGLDFPYGDAFPHDADMDDLAGVDFTKGCYVGQEVVSRMKHRGTARRRVILARAAEGTALPAPGTEITAGGRPLGTLGSSAGAQGLALVRLDRVKAAMDAGEAVLAAGVALALDLPSFARFGWPAEVAAD